MQRTKTVLAATLSVALLLQGCVATTPLAINSPLGAQISEAQARFNTVKQGAHGSVDRFSGPKLAGREVRISRPAQPAEPWLMEPFVYVADSQSLAEVLQSFSEQVERRVRVGAMDEEWNDGAKLRSNFPVDWRKGSVSMFLSHIASRMNASWRVVEGDIEFYQNETRSFQVSLPPGARTMSSSLNLGGAQGGSSGGSSNGSGAQSTVSSTLQINTFEAVLNGVKAVVGADSSGKTGAKVSVVGNPELGLITVTGRPAMLDRVAKHIESINERVAQNVFVQIKVMAVTVNNADYAGLGLDAILSRGLNRLRLEAPIAPVSANGSPGFMTLSRTGGSMSGSEIVFGLLKQAGDVSIVRSGQVIAANGQPAGVQVADEVNYLAQVSTSAVANVGSQTTLTPGSRTVGFTASVLPLIMADSRLLLQYTLNLSSLLGMTQNSSGGQTIQSPQISSQTLQQHAYVRDGESIVLFGFEQARDSIDKTLGLTGGGANTARQRQVMVIVMDVARVGRAV